MAKAGTRATKYLLITVRLYRLHALLTLTLESQRYLFLFPSRPGYHGPLPVTHSGAAPPGT